MIHLHDEASGVRRPLALFRNVLAEGTLAWSSQAADGFARNALGPQTYDFWTPTAVPATLSTTLAAAVVCDCAAIIGHNLGSKGAAVAIEHSADGSAWTAAMSITPTDDADLILIFPDTSARYWRVRVTGAVASIGVAMIGPRLVFPGDVEPDYVPLHHARNVTILPHVTRGGQYRKGRLIRDGAGTSIPLPEFRRSWIESDQVRAFMRHYDDGSPFVWAACPELFPEDGHYCWRAGSEIRVSYEAGADYGFFNLEVAAYVGS